MRRSYPFLRGDSSSSTLLCDDRLATASDAAGREVIVRDSGRALLTQ